MFHLMNNAFHVNQRQKSNEAPWNHCGNRFDHFMAHCDSQNIPLLLSNNQTSNHIPNKLALSIMALLEWSIKTQLASKITTECLDFLLPSQISFENAMLKCLIAKARRYIISTEVSFLSQIHGCIGLIKTQIFSDLDYSVKLSHQQIQTSGRLAIAYETSRGQIHFSVTDWTYRSLLYKFLSSTDFWILIFANEEWISKGICNPSGRTEERESENCPYTITGLHHSQTPKKWSAQRNVNLIFYVYKLIG